MPFFTRRYENREATTRRTGGFRSRFGRKDPDRVAGGYSEHAPSAAHVCLVTYPLFPCDHRGRPGESEHDAHRQETRGTRVEGDGTFRHTLALYGGTSLTAALSPSRVAETKRTSLS